MTTSRYDIRTDTAILQSFPPLWSGFLIRQRRSGLAAAISALSSLLLDTKDGIPAPAALGSARCGGSGRVSPYEAIQSVLCIVLLLPFLQGPSRKESEYNPLQPAYLTCRPISVALQVRFVYCADIDVTALHGLGTGFESIGK
jgi:hypothetical protein